MNKNHVSLEAMNRVSAFMKSVSWIVLVTFVTVTLGPGATAIAQTTTSTSAPDGTVSPGPDDRDQLGKALGKAKGHLRVIADRPDAANQRPSTDEKQAAKEALRSWREELRRLDAEVRAEFAANAELIQRKNLPLVIQQRQADVVATYNAQMTALDDEIEGALNATDPAVVKTKAEAAFRRLEDAQLGRAHQEFDPLQLPNRVLQPDLNRKPATTASAYPLPFFTGIRLAALDPSAFDLSGMPAAADPVFRQATTEVTLTADIVAKAEELHGNPVEIYNWVRNNVQWQPTWGAIQTASHTLSSKRGNAFDISSLTIALLRASGIPARYVHGVIEVPEDKFRNWAGGFQNLSAAVDFVSAGGIPVTSVTSGGVITKVRIEHVWVEAAVDFVPSRGALNRSADSWIAMDPSFKQIEVLPGLDFPRISGIDPLQLADAIADSGTRDEAEGWLSGFDASIFEAAQAQARSALESFISANLPSAKVGDVTGGRRIASEQSKLLTPALPNRVVFFGARYAALPSSLQQEITFAFGNDILGEPRDPITLPWAALNSQRITLTYRPTTQADLDTLNSLLPEGGITDPSQLPTTIPAYLVHVTPELKVNDTVVLSGASTKLGTTTTLVFNPKFVGRGMQRFSYTLPAGSRVVVAAIAGSVDPAELERNRERMEHTRVILESGDPEQRTNLSQERLLDDVLHTGVLGYYGLYMTLGAIAGNQTGGHHGLAAGVGSFGYEPAVDTFFGIPRRLEPGGAVMNIPIVNVVGTEGESPKSTRDYTLYLGALSSVLEHVVPQRLFWSPAMPGESISAMRALAKANEDGQRIYRITAANMSTALPNIHHDPATMAEIRSALTGGRTVVTHTDAVTVPGWVGAGYVIFDPDTGAGAWKIGGGQNGAFIVLAITIGLLAFFGTQLIVAFSVPTLLVVIALGLSFRDYVDDLQQADSPDTLNPQTTAALLRAMLVFFPALFRISEARILGWFASMSILGGEQFE